MVKNLKIKKFNILIIYYNNNNGKKPYGANLKADSMFRVKILNCRDEFLKNLNYKLLKKIK